MTLDHIITFISQYGYLPLFLIAIIEGPIIIIIGGFLASIHVLNIYVVYVIAVLGDVIGDAIYYWIGRRGRKSILPKYGKYLGATEERLKRAEDHYGKHLLKTILLSKLSQVGITTMIVLAGVTKVDFRKFMGIIFLVSLVKGLVFTLIGYYFGSSYQVIGKYLDKYTLAGTIVIIVAIIIYGVYRKRKTNE